ncbi:leucine-rich repeat-containing protein 20 isoform 1-T3 [Molossus nigricans]
MLRKMGEAVARVARKVNETVESGSDTLDLAECKLVSFPIGIYKVLRNVTDQIHLITLANNELKSLTSKFMTTFCQLRELRLEGNCLHRLPSEVSALQHLKAIDLSRNQFRDFPEQLTTLPALETINLEENEIVDICTGSRWKHIRSHYHELSLRDLGICGRPAQTSVPLQLTPPATLYVLPSSHPCPRLCHCGHHHLHLLGA